MASPEFREFAKALGKELLGYSIVLILIVLLIIGMAWASLHGGVISIIAPILLLLFLWIAAIWADQAGYYSNEWEARGKVGWRAWPPPRD